MMGIRLGKCNMCGADFIPLVVKTVLDGSVCNQCARENYKQVVNGPVVNINYDSSILNKPLIENIELRKKIIEAFKDIQSRYAYQIYRCFINDYALYEIHIRCTFRQRKALIISTIDPIRMVVGYSLFAYNKKTNEKEFILKREF